MKLCVVAVKDSALDAFMRPFCVPMPAMAVRSFMDEVKRPDGEMGRHPGDYSLYELGAFDEDSGKFENLDSPRLLMRAVDCVEVKGV